MKVGKSFFFYGWKKLADNSPTKLPISLLLFFVCVCVVIFSKRDTSLSRRHIKLQISSFTGKKKTEL